MTKQDLAARQNAERDAMSARHDAEWKDMRLRHQNDAARLEANTPLPEPLTAEDKACIKNHPRVSPQSWLGHLADAIRMEILHTFYNSYRGRCTRQEMVEEFEPFHSTLELNYQQFTVRRGKPWIYYPTLRPYP